jgi:4,5-DOPA dioxygenase extradiol
MTNSFRSRRHFVQASSAAGALTLLDSLVTVCSAATRDTGVPMPVVFIGHGSPMNAVRSNPFTQALSALGKSLPKPIAVLAVSAHWLTQGVTAVGAQEHPKTIHDFGGFPRELTEMEYPAPGAPALAREAAASVRNGASTGLLTQEWGLDHGSWTVLKHIYPKADIPVFQLSIDYDKPAEFHYALGAQLRALRSRGVLILGSGNVVHNLRATVPNAADGIMAARDWAQAFDDVVKAALAQRDDQALLRYQRHPSARIAVATPDHYFPLIYALGAASPQDAPKTLYEGFQGGTISMRCVQFG